MFIDTLIVSILTTVWLVTLMRPICQLQRLSDLIALFVNLKPQHLLQTKELCYYKPKTKRIVSLMITASGSVDC